MGNSFLGPEHLLLGVIAQSTVPGFTESVREILQANGVTLDLIRGAVKQIQSLASMPEVRPVTESQALQSLRDLIDQGAVQLKVFTRRPLHGKTYICHRQDLNNPITAFVGSSNLTGPGLTTNYELNVDVGFENFVKAVTNDAIRGPLIAVTLWTFGFAILSVLTTFVLGLAMAILLNDKRIKGLKVYRTLMILPYAFPAFLSALVWQGMFNQDFGFINQTLFGGASIPWLQDPWLAKLSILIVNLWLGFPYMFLVTTGAIQAIPEDIQEAGKVDGAGVWQIFRHIKFPLLLVSVAPLLISSFAFNFNNFNLIYMLTGGGPRFADASINVGASDILISMVYKVAFVGAERDYGLASAFSIIIFVLVAVISYLSFRQTKVLEELN